MTLPEQPPFSLFVKVRKLPSKGRLFTFDADENVLKLIADENDLLSVESFVATAHVSPWKGDGVTISGRVTARVTQPCAISGEPLETAVSEELDVIFVPDTSKLAKPRRSDESELILDPEGDDIPDIFSGDTIDLSGPWLETFVLGLDPFASIDGAEIAKTVSEDTEESPFAVLARLKTH